MNMLGDQYITFENVDADTRMRLITAVRTPPSVLYDFEVNGVLLDNLILFDIQIAFGTTLTELGAPTTNTVRLGLRKHIPNKSDK
jgi:hypothetical protein